MEWRVVSICRRIVLIAGFASAVACGEDGRPQDIRESITVTTFAGTCGSWLTTLDESTGQKVVVTADCEPGIYCANGLWKGNSPDDLYGRHFGICLPPEASTCDKDGKCPDPLGCVTGSGIGAGGVCVLGCATSADCPDEFQLCDGSCQFVACSQSGKYTGYESCPTGSHCQDGSCRVDD